MTSDDLKVQHKIQEAIRYVLQPSSGDNFLIINRNSDHLSALTENAAKTLKLNAETFSLNKQGPYDRFPSELKENILSRKYPRAIGLFTYPEGTDWGQKETPARVDLLYEAIKKTPMGYLHAPGINSDMILNGPGRVNFKEMITDAEKMLETLKGVKTVQIKAPAGTDIEIEIPSELIWETDCIVVPPDPYGDPGIFGNFVPGEVCIERRRKVSVAGREVKYPIKLIANGTIVCDVCADNINKLVDPAKPITISFKDGVLTDYRSPDEAFQVLHEEWKQREAEYGLPTVMEELGIGINDKARRTPEMLEAEKMDGTAHAAAAHVNSHADFLVDRPTVTVIYEDKSKKTIMKDGVLKLN
ncbi:MAG: hypothetical protein GTN36_01100 [Candidatus Aenigmarchaeota archaeon]|nr:hypothetical protein [Candidatus Aenigmarchaeota archaeon]